MKIIVIGAGIWGASTAYYLQKAGFKVHLVDMWGPGNVRSGSGGVSRIIRLVYGADEIYMNLTARSFELWPELLSNRIADYYEETGLLWMFAGHDAGYALASRSRMAALGYELEELTREDIVSAYPQISTSGIQRFFFEEKAGILYASRCTRRIVKLFQESGGHYSNGYASYHAHDIQPVELNGKKADADKFVFACGPWNRRIFPEILQPYTYVSKQDVYHFTVPPEKSRTFDVRHLPLWFNYDPNSPMYYGMPMHGGVGFKIAYDDRSDIFDPDLDDRTINLSRLQQAREFIARRFPALNGSPVSYSEVCQYDNSLDGHFLIDYHPLHPNVLIMGGSSGHGFKMGPALGELIARHFSKGQPIPEQFRFQRFLISNNRRTQFLPNL